LPASAVAARRLIVDLSGVEYPDGVAVNMRVIPTPV
jgi:hypothetical protein